jgi:hypothetical protein
MRIYSLQIKTFSLVFEKKNYIPHVKLKNHFLRQKSYRKVRFLEKLDS